MQKAAYLGLGSYLGADLGYALADDGMVEVVDSMRVGQVVVTASLSWRVENREKVRVAR